MADSRFFTHSGPMSLEAIAALTGAVIAMRGNAPVDGKRLLRDVAPLDQATADDLSFLDNVKYVDAFAASKAGACFVRAKYVECAPKAMALLVTEDPYYCYALTARQFYPDPPQKGDIAKSAVIAKSVSMGKNVRIDPGAVIADRATIGDDCWIGANAVIGDGVAIGEGSRIGACTTISHTLIGKRAIIHPGVHIGQDGFGFAPGGRGILKVPQIGRVVIGDDVEIGSATCIDRGAGPDTIIGDGVKIDNQVQIGHNVRIGKYAIIVSQCGISGSTQIGDGVMLGGKVGVSGHVHVGNGAKIAAGSGVITDVPAGATWGGYPAGPVRNWHRQTLAMAKLVNRKDSNEG